MDLVHLGQGGQAVSDGEPLAALGPHQDDEPRRRRILIQGGADPHSIPLDQPADSLAHSLLRYPDMPRELEVGHPSVLCQQFEDLLVQCIELRHAYLLDPDTVAC